jgi:hypothetical protein
MAPNARSNQLRLAPNLRRIGIAAQWQNRTAAEKIVRIVMGSPGRRCRRRSQVTMMDGHFYRLEDEVPEADKSSRQFVPASRDLRF